MILETELWPNLYARMRPAGRAAGARERAGVAALGRQVPAAGAAVPQDAVERHRHRRAKRGGRRAIPLDRRHHRSARTWPATSSSTSSRRQASRRAAGAGASRTWPGRPVWVAGSTHEGEEAIVLDAHRHVLAQLSRSAADAGAAASAALRHGARPAREAARGRRIPLDGGTIPPGTRVLLGDTMGELMMFYAAADVAFVAGSLVPIGGHNLLEPASVGLPVLTGPHNFNGEEIAQLLVDAGARARRHRIPCSSRTARRGAARRCRAAHGRWARPARPCSTRIAARSTAC